MSKVRKLGLCVVVASALSAVASTSWAGPTIALGGNDLDPLVSTFAAITGGTSIGGGGIFEDAPDLTAMGAGDTDGDGTDEIYWGDVGFGSGAGNGGCVHRLGGSPNTSVFCGSSAIRDIGFADTDGDGADEMFVVEDELGGGGACNRRVAVAGGDLDFDGIDEVLYACDSGAVIAQGGGSVAGGCSTGSIRGLGIGDVDGDGLIDVVAGCSDDSITVNGEPMLFATGTLVDIAVADLDANGYADVVALKLDGHAEVLHVGPLGSNVVASYQLSSSAGSILGVGVTIALNTSCATNEECIDADPCNGVEQCSSGSCVPGPLLNCLSDPQVCQDDSDGDGLLDVWETQGVNVDCDSASSVEVDLPTMGADSRHKDVFLEIDFTQHGSEPSQAMVRSMKLALRAAPLYTGGINNADNLPGVHLHVDTGDLDDPLGIEPGPTAGSCEDGFDNDNDGATDDFDSDCLSNYGMEGVGPCNDNIDNDNDGVADAFDSDCFGREFLTTGSCTDGIDNNLDGFPDGLDQGCSNPGVRYMEGGGYCSDGIDDDLDGDTDLDDTDCNVGDSLGRGGERVSLGSYPRGGFTGLDESLYDISASNFDRGNLGSLFKYAVTGLSFNNTVDESGATALEGGSMDARSCEDFTDNDGNGLTDIEDPACQICNDGMDNDLDGLFDSADPNCIFRSKGGQGEIGGNDIALFNTPQANLFVPMNGGLRGPDPGTALHELGHTLNLKHGGFEDHNCKPNYVSIMNYQYQFGIQQVMVPSQLQDIDRDGQVDQAIIDFWPPRNTSFLGRSDIEVSLVENLLDESDVIDGNDFDNTFSFIDPTGTRQTGIPLVGQDLNSDGVPDGTDWNINMSIDLGTVAVNIDTSDQSGWPSKCTNSGPPAGPALPLAAFSDWRNIIFNQRLFGDDAGEAINASEEVAFGISNREPESLRQARTTDLSIALTGPTTAASGSTVEITVTIENKGAKIAYDTQVRMELPPGTTLVESTANCQSYVSDSVNCYLNGIAVGDTLTFTVTLQLGTLEEVQCDGPAVRAVVTHDGPDPAAGNNTAVFSVGGLDAGPWPMRSRCPKHQARSSFAGPESGAFLWAYVTGDAVRSSPAVSSSGLILFGSDDGRVRALNKDGTRVWSFATDGAVRSTPALGSNGIAYFGSDDGGLYAVNSATGDFTWRFSTGDDVDSSPVVGTDGVIYVGSKDKHLYAVNADGTLKWKFKTQGSIASSPAVGSDRTVYVGSHDGRLYAFSPDGEKLWSFVTEASIISSPTIGIDGTIFIGSDDGSVFAINPDGSEKWRFSTPHKVRSSAAIGDDGTVYIGIEQEDDDDKFGELLALHPGTGELEWSFAVDGGIVSAPAVDDGGVVFVGSRDGQLYALSPGAVAPDDRLLFSLDLQRDIISSPAIGDDGTIYVGSDSGKLFAINAEGTVAPEPGCRLITKSGHNYWFCDQKHDQASAQASCVAVGMDLVSIGNAAENTFVSAMIHSESWIAGATTVQPQTPSQPPASASGSSGGATSTDAGVNDDDKSARHDDEDDQGEDEDDQGENEDGDKQARDDSTVDGGSADAGPTMNTSDGGSTVQTPPSSGECRTLKQNGATHSRDCDSPFAYVCEDIGSEEFVADDEQDKHGPHGDRDTGCSVAHTSNERAAGLLFAAAAMLLSRRLRRQSRALRRAG